MITLIMATAALLGVIVVAALVAILIFVMQIRRFLRQTLSALELAGEEAAGFAGRIQGIQHATLAAAGELTPVER
ncbi:MAG: hypothetical protein M3N53_08960 [Actinomycetota bacterium]|nr:hypothetical protein [Actinomycetota bacterium]